MPKISLFNSPASLYFQPIDLWSKAPPRPLPKGFRRINPSANFKSPPLRHPSPPRSSPPSPACHHPPGPPPPSPPVNSLTPPPPSSTRCPAPSPPPPPPTTAIGQHPPSSATERAREHHQYHQHLQVPLQKTRHCSPSQIETSPHA